jgi:hypothetical protein
MKACIKYGLIKVNQYFDIVNIDRYDVTLETVFMRKHRIILNLKKKSSKNRRQRAPDVAQICRQAMYNRLDTPKDRDALNKTEGSYGKNNRH